jgi:dolichol-phosphate mannosyltransferase
MAEFSLLSRRVREELIKGNNSFPFLRAEIGNVGFKQIGIDYTRQARVAGKTNYNFQRMTLFAVAGILSSSTFLLRLVVYLFVPVIVVNFVMLLFNAEFLKYGIVINFMYMNFALLAFSFYLARLYKNILNRPLFIIDELNSDYY